jgi:ligand-binding sensor domain-containing protein
MRLSGTGARVAVTTVGALLFAGTPSGARAERATSAADAPVPELSLAGQHTFTGEVRDLLVLEDEVWAATGGGLAIHRRSDGAHRRTLTSADGLPGNSLRSLLLVDATHVAVGGDFGAALVDLAKVREGRPRAIELLGCQDGCMRFDPVYALAPTSGGLWLLRHRGGLERWTRDRHGAWTRQRAGAPGSWRALAGGPAPVLGGLDGRVRFEDGTGRATASFTLPAPVLALGAGPNGMVAATGEKLLQIRPDGVRTLVAHEAGGSRSPAASALSVPAADGSLLVGTAGGELFVLRGEVLVPASPRLGGRVTAVASDGPRVWLGLGRAGLHLLAAGATAQAVRPAGEICDNHVVAIARFGKFLVAGTFDQGACYLEDGAWHAIAGLPSPMVHGLGSDGRDLYIATSNSLSRYDRKLAPRPIGKGDPSVLRWVSQSATTAIAQLDGGGLAITSAYGLVQLQRAGTKLSAVFTGHRAGVPLKLTAVAADAGEIWMASEAQGVKSLGTAEQPVRHLQDPEDLPENWVTAVAASPGALWVGTCQHGVARLRDQGFRDRRFIDRRNLLPDDMVSALAADARGAFIGTLGGLTFAAAEGTAGRTFGWAAGIPDPRSAGLLLDGSSLWLGTEAGLAQYRIE